MPLDGVDGADVEVVELRILISPSRRRMRRVGKHAMAEPSGSDQHRVSFRLLYLHMPYCVALNLGQRPC